MDLSTLLIYQVSVPGDDQNALEEALGRIERGEIETLKSVDLVRKVFADRTEGHIQIVVKGPSKLPLAHRVILSYRPVASYHLQILIHVCEFN